MKAHILTDTGRKWHSSRGSSVLETLMVVGIGALLASITLPQIISARRLMRSAALPREIATQLRFTRQQAMSQRQAFTFQYDDTTKRIQIIDHNNNNNANASCNMPGTTVLADSAYPTTACSTTVLQVPLAGSSGLAASELSFGVPSGITATTLSDNTTPTALTASKINITFQPDGTVIDTNGNPVNRTMFLYNNQAAQQTACAISVLGTAGRIKVWRYDASANKYAE